MNPLKKKTPEDYIMISKIWGKEIWIRNSPQYCGKVLLVEPGYICSLHLHKNKTETFYVLQGQLGLFYCNQLNGHEISQVLKGNRDYDVMPKVQHEGEFVTLYPKESITIPKGTLHRFKAIDGPCTFLEISTFHEDADSYRVIGEESRELKGVDK